MQPTSICSKCRQEKSTTDFYRDRNRPSGLTSQCRVCSRERSRKNYHANPDKHKAMHREWVARNPDRIAFHRAKHAFGISREEYDALKSVCTICGSRDYLAIDHSHQSGRIRGRLCQSCNKGLGFFRDNPALLLRASDYILGCASPDIFTATYEMVS